MNIPLACVISINYPTADLSPGGNVQLADHGDGNGAVIQSWNVPGVEQPSTEQLSALQVDVNTVASYTALQNVQANALIQAQILQIGIEAIPALLSANAVLISGYNNQVIALQAQLLPTTAAAVIAAQNKS